MTFYCLLSRDNEGTAVERKILLSVPQTRGADKKFFSDTWRILFVSSTTGFYTKQEHQYVTKWMMNWDIQRFCVYHWHVLQVIWICCWNLKWRNKNKDSNLQLTKFSTLGNLEIIFFPPKVYVFLRRFTGFARLSCRWQGTGEYAAMTGVPGRGKPKYQEINVSQCHTLNQKSQNGWHRVEAGSPRRVPG